MYIHQDVDTSGHWHDGQSPPALQADCSASLEVHAWALVRAPCLLHPQERRQSITGYAKQVMHVSVLLPPEKVNSNALVLGSWQMHHIHTSRQSARNYSKRCTVSSLMHPHGDAWASSVPSRTSIYVSPCHLGTWMHAWPAWHRLHTAVAMCVH